MTNFDVVFKFDLSIKLDLVFGPNLIALKVKFDLIGGLIWLQGQIWLYVKFGQENRFDFVVKVGHLVKFGLWGQIRFSDQIDYLAMVSNTLETEDS